MVEPPEQEQNDAQTGFPPDLSGGGAGGSAPGPMPPAAPTPDEQLDEDGIARNAILGEIMSLMESTVAPAQSGTQEDGLPPEGFLVAQASEMTVTEPAPPAPGTGDASDFDRALQQAQQLTAEQVIDFGGQKEPPGGPSAAPQPQAVEEPVRPSAPPPSEPPVPMAAAAPPVREPAPTPPTPAPVPVAAQAAVVEPPKVAAPAQVEEARPATKVMPAQPAAAKPATRIVPAPEKPTPPQTTSQTTRIEKQVKAIHIAKMAGGTLSAILHILLLPFRIPARLFILLAKERRIVTIFVLRHNRQLLVLLSFLVGMAWLLVGLTNLSLIAIILAVVLLFPAFFFAIGVLK